VIFSPLTRHWKQDWLRWDLTKNPVRAFSYAPHCHTSCRMLICNLSWNMDASTAHRTSDAVYCFLHYVASQPESSRPLLRCNLILRGCRQRTTLSSRISVHVQLRSGLL